MEIALRITEIRREKVTAKGQRVLTWKPVGSVASVYPLRMIRWHRVFHVGVNAAPDRRGRYAHNGAIVAWSTVWKPRYLEIAREMEHEGRDPLECWAEIIRDGDITNLGLLDVRGDISLEDTLWWGQKDLKDHCILRLDDTLDWQQAVQLAGTVEEVDGDRIVSRAKAALDYHGLPEMSGTTLAEIDDPAVTFHPRRNYIVSSSALVEPDIQEVRGG